MEILLCSILIFIAQIVGKLATAYPLQDHIYQKKELNKFIIHRNETIRVNLEDYISGSFIDYNITVWNEDIIPPEIIVNNSCIYLASPYKEVKRSYSLDQPLTFPMLKNTLTFNLDDVRYQDMEFILYISSSYEIIINNRDFFVMDIKPIIRDYITHFNVEDLFCNNLVEAKLGSIFILPCKLFERSFIIWMKMSRVDLKFSFKVFAQNSLILIDKYGRNSLDTFVVIDSIFILSSSGEKLNMLSLIKVDISTIDQNFVKEKHIKNYYSSDFDYQIDINLDPFNIRDILVYNEFPFSNDKVSNILLYNVLVGCYDNGLISFQVKVNAKNQYKDKMNSNDYDDPAIFLVDCEPIAFAGTIFFEKDFKLKPFKQIYMLQAIPFSIIEVSLANNNMNINRIYRLTAEENNKVVGKDLLSVNEDYIAAVLFDYDLYINIVRIFRRNVANNEIGFFDIPISDFGHEILSINFICDDLCDQILVRTATMSIIYQVYNKELVFETWSKSFDDFDKLKNKNIVLHIDARNSVIHTQKFSFTISTRFVDDADSSIYYIKPYYYVDSWHEYGDKGFKFTISEFYSGPQMTFEMQFNSSVLYPNIILPNISNHFTMQQMQIADINQECLFSFVNRYITEHNCIELTEYFCILEKQIIQISIDKPLTEEVGSYDYKDKYFLYPRDKFIASFFYDSDYSEFDTIDKLVLVSENVYTNPHTYILNFFEIRNELSWRYKFAIDNRKYQIRSGRSIYGFPNGKFFIFIDKQSFIIFITSKEGAFITSTTSDYQIDKIYTINNQIFCSTFQNVNKLYLYKLYEASDYYIKFVQAIQSNQRIIDVGINQNNEIVLFSGSNNIYLIKVKGIDDYEVVRKMPLFEFESFMEFRVNSVNEQVVFLFRNHTLLVVMRSKYDFKYIRVFCYDTSQVSHSSLYTIIPLEERYFENKINIFIGFNDYKTTIPLYVIYDSKIIRKILVEPEIFLAQTNWESNKIFLPENYRNLPSYLDDNVTISIFPNYNSVNNFESCYLTFFCYNYGLLIETTLESQQLDITAHVRGNLTISLLDIFNGFNSTFQYNSINNKNQDAIKDLDINFSKNNKSLYILEFSKTDQAVLYSFEYMKTYLFIFFTGDNYLLQGYDIRNGITKLSQEYNYNKLFDGCTLQYVHYDIISSTHSSYITTNCDNITNQIQMEYIFKLFYIKEISEDKFELDLIVANRIAAPLRESQFFKDSKSNSTYFLVVLTELASDNTDSNLYILSFNCSSPKDCNYLKYAKITGYRLEYNRFFCKSFTYLNDYPLLAVALNDFGLVFINLNDKDYRVIHQLPLKSLEMYAFDQITIYKVFKISNNGLRVLIKEMGGFSLYWDKIFIEREKDIFNNIYIKHWINKFEGEEPTDLVTKTSIGYAQIVYFPNNKEAYDASLRIYNLFNKDKSKILYEINIGKVAFCNSITSSTEDNEHIFQINVICESTIFTISVNLYPEIMLQNIDKNGHIKFTLLAENLNSDRKINVDVFVNNDNKFEIPKWIIILFTLAFCLFICSIIFKMSQKSNKKQQEKPKRDPKESYLKLLSNSKIDKLKKSVNNDSSQEYSLVNEGQLKISEKSETLGSYIEKYHHRLINETIVETSLDFESSYDK